MQSAIHVWQPMQWTAEESKACLDRTFPMDRSIPQECDSNGYTVAEHTTLASRLAFAREWIRTIRYRNAVAVIRDFMEG